MDAGIQCSITDCVDCASSGRFDRLRERPTVSIHWYHGRIDYVEHVEGGIFVSGDVECLFHDPVCAVTAVGRDEDGVVHGRER